MAKSSQRLSVLSVQNALEDQEKNAEIKKTPPLRDILKSERDTGSAESAFVKPTIEAEQDFKTEKVSKTDAVDQQWLWEDYFTKSLSTTDGLKTMLISPENANFLKQLASSNKCTVISLVNNILTEFKQKNIKNINKSFKNSLL